MSRGALHSAVSAREARSLCAALAAHALIARCSCARCAPAHPVVVRASVASAPPCAAL